MGYRRQHVHGIWVCMLMVLCAAGCDCAPVRHKPTAAVLQVYYDTHWQVPGNLPDSLQHLQSHSHAIAACLTPQEPTHVADLVWVCAQEQYVAATLYGCTIARANGMLEKFSLWSSAVGMDMQGAQKLQELQHKRIAVGDSITMHFISPSADIQQHVASTLLLYNTSTHKVWNAQGVEVSDSIRAKKLPVQATLSTKDGVSVLALEITQQEGYDMGRLSLGWAASRKGTLAYQLYGIEGTKRVSQKIGAGSTGVDTQVSGTLGLEYLADPGQDLRYAKGSRVELHCRGAQKAYLCEVLLIDSVSGAMEKIACSFADVEQGHGAV